MQAPLKRTSAKDAVISYIEDFITEQGLQPGMALPSEGELVSSLGVSRNIVREALQYYKTLGIIDSRPKTGAYVKQLFPENPFAAYMPFIKDNKVRIREIGQLRMIVELGIIPLLLQRVSKDDLKQLTSIIEQMEKTKLRQDALHLEIDFHAYLLDIVGNEILIGLKPLLLEFFEKVSTVQISQSDRKTIKHIAEEHDEILQAIRQKNERELTQLIKEHYQHYINL